MCRLRFLRGYAVASHGCLGKNAKGSGKYQPVMCSSPKVAGGSLISQTCSRVVLPAICLEHFCTHMNGGPWE